MTGHSPLSIKCLRYYTHLHVPRRGREKRQEKTRCNEEKHFAAKIGIADGEQNFAWVSVPSRLYSLTDLFETIISFSANARCAFQILPRWCILSPFVHAQVYHGQDLSLVIIHFTGQMLSSIFSCSCAGRSSTVTTWVRWRWLRRYCTRTTSCSMSHHHTRKVARSGCQSVFDPLPPSKQTTRINKEYGQKCRLHRMSVIVQ